MTESENKEIVRRYYEHFFSDPSIANQLFSASYSHSPDLLPGPEGIIEERTRMLDRLGSEFSIMIHNLIAEEDLVVAEVTLTGREHDLRQINWYRVSAGRISERWWVEGTSDFEPVRSLQQVADARVRKANKALVRRYYEEVAANPSVADELFADQHLHYPGLQLGPEGVKELIRLAKSKFGDGMSVALEHMIAERDLVAADFTLSGQGQCTREMCMFRIAGNKISGRSCVYCDPPPGSKFCR